MKIVLCVGVGILLAYLAACFVQASWLGDVWEWKAIDRIGLLSWLLVGAYCGFLAVLLPKGV